MPKKPKYCKNLRSKKKWVEDFEKANNLLKNFKWRMIFIKRRRTSEEELDNNTIYQIYRKH
jgi:hypothetical protein